MIPIVVFILFTLILFYFLFMRKRPFVIETDTFEKIHPASIKF